MFHEKESLVIRPDRQFTEEQHRLQQRHEPVQNESAGAGIPKMVFQVNFYGMFGEIEKFEGYSSISH
jgi:hypothetical protein